MNENIRAIGLFLLVIVVTFLIVCFMAMKAHCLLTFGHLPILEAPSYCTSFLK